ncbi:SWIM zinc finger family protein [Nocardiopsis synnemataformans]|uniref:SWIM zinc finger family protein n=1 Tax=Nocardiopsis synnemataformans TaxID=61305 RepID=UPI003EB6D4E0
MGARQPICQSWWSARLLQGIADGDPGRLSRGRTYMRRGAVIDVRVDVERAMVSASVRGSRGRPYQVAIVYQTVEAYRWDRILEELAQDPDATADLLSDELPGDAEEVFARHGARLFPDSADDLDIRCTCPDWGHPCKHGAAVLYEWASALDDAPLLLFAWLGRTEDEVIDALGASGAGNGPGGELEVTVTPLADHVADFWTAGEPARLVPPRSFDPLAHWEGATPGVASRLAPMYERLGRTTG